MQLINSKKRRQPSRFRGFTMIEILVSVLIFAIGLLGLAGMQGQAKRYMHEAWQNTQATFYLRNMYERIRANTDPDFPGMLAEYTVQDVTSYDKIDCSATSQSGIDLCELKSAMEGSLSNDDGDKLQNPFFCITFDNAGGALGTNVLVNITIGWLSLSPIGGTVLDDTCTRGDDHRYQRQVFLNTNNVLYQKPTPLNQ